MQERLDKWRKKTLAVPSVEKVIGPARPGKVGSRGDYGDVLTLEEWEEEVKRSQTRR